MGNSKKEPSTAPQTDRWYNLTLGSSLTHPSSSKFCTLRYEFKPASIDKSQPGILHKNKDNRVTVEFHNNQYGKPKVTFEGSSEDYKENDAVLFFDGESFRLERLHRAVKRLRHVRLPGESAAPSSSLGPPVESCSPPIGKVAKVQSSSISVVQSMPVEVERIDIGEPESSGPKPKSGKVGHQYTPPPSPFDLNKYGLELEEHLEIVNDEGDGNNTIVTDPRTSPEKPYHTVTNPRTSPEKPYHTGIDINIPHQNDTDDEIADVDLSDDDVDKGQNAAEALRAQVNAEEREKQSSSSSSSSGSDSSGSGSSGSGSSSDSDTSDDDVSVTSI